ncbi:hypothetical protein Tco_1006949, partial [Tanacetum coccineum]
QRQVGETVLNDSSSRSHQIITLDVDGKLKCEMGNEDLALEEIYKDFNAFKVKAKHIASCFWCCDTVYFGDSSSYLTVLMW